METKTELEKKNILRQSNKEANAITRECIESALVLLMNERPFTEISITDIIKKAGVSRASYYRNYGTKEAILEGYLDNIIATTSNALLQFDVKTQGRDAYLKLLEITKVFSDEYRLLLQAGFGDTILRRFISSMNTNNPTGNKILYTTNCYVSGALFAVITQWILDDMKTEPAIIADVCTQLLLSGLNEIPKCTPKEKSW